MSFEQLQRLSEVKEEIENILIEASDQITDAERETIYKVADIILNYIYEVME